MVGRGCRGSAAALVALGGDPTRVLRGGRVHVPAAAVPGAADSGEGPPSQHRQSQPPAVSFLRAVNCAVNA